MRLCACIISVLVLVSAGCGRESSNPVEEYGDTLISSLDKAERAQLTVNLRTVRMGIDAFAAENGRFPDSLDDLDLNDIVTAYYDYDPETGKVAVRNP